jgi:ATP-dependent protease HslVU (ClpYQ) peptidase subunit
MVADCRLTFGDDTQARHSDVCQKIVGLGRVGLVGFAGDVETATTVIQWMATIQKLRGLSWLTKPEEVASLLEACKLKYTQHYAELLVMFVDKWHEVLPGVRGTVLVRFSTNGDLTKSYLGVEAIGSGQDVLQPLKVKFIDLLNFSTHPDGDITPLIHTALLVAEFTDGFVKEHRIDSVGGLFQIMLLTSSGIYAVPYERWVDVTPELGTYVCMDIDAVGRWVQRHEPSGLSVPLGNPFRDEFTIRDRSQNLTFDLAERLTHRSPGIRKRSNPQYVFGPIHGEWVLRTP